MKTVIRCAALAACLVQCSCLDGLAFSLTPGGQMALTFTTPPPAKVVPLDDKGSK
jgi:hypothetical protein